MNLWKGEFIMRKNVKIIVGVVVLILVLVVGSWGMTATWVSEDSASYLVCKKENDEPFANVTAYFQGVDGWQAYELNSIDRIVYLDIVKDGVVVDGTSGYMKFDGTTFTITDLDKDTFGADEFHYVITDKEFSPE